ncbi:lytic transglycosylase domain-containing protein [Pseudomonas typographi]|uniref:Transglycosylase SLT domain-containing protein n=1 Tax=Pseudomonas typographi TaxID=2715964 RepID=A0ABR7Z0R0_9PSED|nr:lytic transglycosylase domain-containing protein [Pseudomonas typographi]MBD1553423.1 transglycosylase SLT domain-containing protein [Pseudomonas typographi]MBD1588705.1 transglycosylase SLT domain-containing protein [Pseudomonas typographi]MBD1599045.1 transglycosylase SLT domain-containing protein [Pseudomonas typographi]
MSSTTRPPLLSNALTRLAQAVGVACSVALVGCQSTALVPEEAPTPVPKLAKRSKPKPVFLDAQAQQPARDIWERLRQGFQLQDDLDVNPRVEQQRLWFVGNPAFLTSAADRGSLYMHYIVERLEERNMPLELALLPAIESAYNPMALSRAQAVGLWQFIPSTGRYFNLRQTNLYDGRRDVTASTTAALDYLSKLHDMFGGDWLLALAAYNAGEGTVSRAIERNERLGLPIDYWNLSLPQETMDYVPKLLALSEVVSSPRAYGIDLEPIANQPYFKVVEVDQRLDLSRLAAMANIDEDELYQLNPAFKQRETLDRPQHLLVPTAKAQLVTAGLSDPQQLIALRPSRPAVERVATVTPASPSTYKVRRGDNLASIAKANKVSVRDLQRWNKLTGKHLQVGQALVMNDTSPSSRKVAANKQRATQYRVREGDSLYQVAKRFNVQAQHLKRWNPQVAKALKPGQMLTVYLDR